MKRLLLFSALFITALVLSSPAAQAKTHYHHKQYVDVDEKSFPAGIFYQEPTMGGTPPDQNGYMDSYEMQTKEDALVIKKMDSFSGAASMNSDTYLVYFVGTQFATYQYLCSFAGIFEQITKKKELTLVDSYKKLGCKLKVIAIKQGSAFITLKTILHEASFVIMECSLALVIIIRIKNQINISINFNF